MMRIKFIKWVVSMKILIYNYLSGSHFAVIFCSQLCYDVL